MAARKDTSENFLQRWSRRKTAPETPEAESDRVAEAPVSPAEEQPPAGGPAESEQDKPIWQRQDADPAERRQALKDLFQQSKFNQTDGLEEYENDYNYKNFAKLGAIVTHEMRRFIERQAASSESPADDANPQDKTVNDSEHTEDDEDNRLG